MKRIFSKAAFSLLELIVASVLVVIVILGIFAIDSVLSNSNQDYGQRYLVKSETQTTLNHILNNASEAIGSGTFINGNPDQGIVLSTLWTPRRDFAICIHQDIDPTQPLDSTSLNNPPTAPPNYSYTDSGGTVHNSRWLCYNWYFPGHISPCPNSVSNCDYQIWYCEVPYTTTVTYGYASCDLIASPPPKYLGTANGSIPNNLVTSATINSTTGLTVTIQNCLDNTQASGNCGTPNNPQVTLTGSAFPSQQGATQN